MKVLVTGGGTMAPIDDVRYIANVSSGRFSAAITEACLRLGATVWHVHAPSAILPFEQASKFDLDSDDPDVEFSRLLRLRDEFLSMRHRLNLVALDPGHVADYAEALERILSEEPIDIAFLAMAVSDYEPKPVSGKIDSSNEDLVIPCKKTPKVIRSIRDWAPSVYLVGFKLMSGAETPELLRQAELACTLNRANVTVANELSMLREGRHTVHLVRPGHEPETLGPTPDLAEQVVDRVFTFAAGKAGGAGLKTKSPPRE